jgi:hypothetical protein
MSRLVCVFLSRFAVFLDGLMIRHAHRIPGVVSGGVFYWGHRPFLYADMWAEPGTYTLRVGRLEIILDRK